MQAFKKMMFVFILLNLGIINNVNAKENKDNELSMSIGLVSAGFSYKKRIGDNFLIGSEVGFGSSRSVSMVSSESISEGSIRDVNWLEFVGSFKASNLVTINTGISYANYARVLDEFIEPNDFGNSMGFFVQPEIGSDNIKIGTKIALKKFHENEFDNGMGVQWTPLILRLGIQW